MTSSFMRHIVDATVDMQNAVALSQLANANSTSQLSEKLSDLLQAATVDLDKAAAEVTNATNSTTLSKKQTEYQKKQTQWQSVESLANTNVQTAQDMTTRDSQHTQTLLQFASVANGVVSYLGSLMQSSY